MIGDSVFNPHTAALQVTETARLFLRTLEQQTQGMLWNCDQLIASVSHPVFMMHVAADRWPQLGREEEFDMDDAALDAIGTVPVCRCSWLE